jgi:hypothetical protein
MAVFKRFEDIKAWQKAREVTKRIYLITSDEKFFRDYGLHDQIRRRRFRLWRISRKVMDEKLIKISQTF